MLHKVFKTAVNPAE